jgi:tyrosyl-tRNA synthetase
MKSVILDIEKTNIVYNSSWLSKLKLDEFVKIAGKITVARLIERDEFQKRLGSGIPVGFHELFYPVFQAYDSIELSADVEIGGTDQTFNMLMGRFLQEQFGLEPQVVITMPILEGLDGKMKMSKSLGNYVGLWERAEDAFCKLMSIPDELMWRYMELLLGMKREEIEERRKDLLTGRVRPIDMKKKMAHEIVAKFWSESEAGKGEKFFSNLHQKKDYSSADTVELGYAEGEEIWVIELLKACNSISTTSEGKRLIDSSAVEYDGNRIADFRTKIKFKRGAVLKVGKKFIVRLH